jgi:hypothetical protein
MAIGSSGVGPTCVGSPPPVTIVVVSVGDIVTSAGGASVDPLSSANVANGVLVAGRVGRVVGVAGSATLVDGLALASTTAGVLSNRVTVVVSSPSLAGEQPEMRSNNIAKKIRLATRDNKVIRKVLTTTFCQYKIIICRDICAVL